MVRTVEIDGQEYYLRKFTVADYFAEPFDGEDKMAGLVGMLAMCLCDANGVRTYTTTEDAKPAIEAMPFMVASRLSQEASDLNGLSEKKESSA